MFMKRLFNLTVSSDHIEALSSHVLVSLYIVDVTLNWFYDIFKPLVLEDDTGIILTFILA